MTDARTLPTGIDALPQSDTWSEITGSVDMAGRRVLDIGAGTGRFAARLAELGGDVVAVEPQEDVVRGRDVGRAAFVIAVAEALPLATASVDLVLFNHSLHHVPIRSMASALSEARRVLRDDGRAVVVEPVAVGPQQELMVLFDDETDVRQAAFDCVRSADGFAIESDHWFSGWSVYEDYDDFRHRMIRVDPVRERLMRGAAAILASRFAEHATYDSEGRARFPSVTRITHLLPQ